MRREDIVSPAEMVYHKERKTEVLARNIYKGCKYAVVNLGTHPSAYISMPYDHPYQKEDDMFQIDIPVHGGCTYIGEVVDWVGLPGKVVGWDYGHAGDYVGYNTNDSEGRKWSTEEMIEECHKAIDKLIGDGAEI